MLAALAEVGFVRRLLEAPLAGSMKITLALTRIGSHRGRSLGLASGLGRLYCSQRGELAEVACLRSGEVQPVDLDGPMPSTDLAVTLVGPGLESLWAAEDGCHVWTRTDGTSEVVRVRVHRDRDASEVLEERAEALVSGEPVDTLGRAVRRIRYDGGPGDSRSHLLTIEDFTLGEVYRRHTTKLGDGLEALLWLRMTWDTEATDGA